MTLPALFDRLALPLIGAPMFIVSGPELVIAQCRAGIVGAIPALNARPPEVLDQWLGEIAAALAAHDQAQPDQPAAPFAVNLIVHRSNSRLEQDLAICVRHRVPVIITSLGARPEVNEAIHGYGGLVLHDVTTPDYARKAIDKGADGLIAVAAGAGGHAGTLSPFALIAEIRQWFDGPLALSGAIATGQGILAAQAMGADLAYIGSAFIATREAQASDGYKQAIIDGRASDIRYTDYFTGIPGNYLRASILAAGLDPDALPRHTEANLGAALSGAKAWRDIWGAGQGVGAIDAVVPVAERIARFAAEYRQARRALG